MRVGAIVRADDQHAREVISLAKTLGGADAATFALLAEPAQTRAGVGAVRGAVVSPDADLAELAAAVGALLGDSAPDVILIPDGPLFEAVGARLAGSLGRTAARDVASVEIEGEMLRVVKGAFGGKAAVALEATGCAVLGVRQGASEAQELSELPVAMVDVPHTEPLLVQRRAVRDSAGDDLGAAKVIVSGGRGLGSKDAYESLREVATLLGASLGASRAAVDEGWATPSQQVGITGQKVAPDVYFAIGISGASQHLGGMSGARYVVAVNRDEKAPIFVAADVGVVADWHALWPELRRALTGA